MRIFRVFLKNIRQLWRGTLADNYGEAAVINTLAITLYSMRKQETHDAAIEMARQLWHERSRGLI